MPRRNFIITAAVLLWLAALVGGLSVLHSYGGQDTPTDGVVDRWVDSTELGPAPDQTTIVFFVHPKCPCTRASIDELAQLLRNVDEPRHPAVRVVMRMPGDPDDARLWSKGDLWEQAAALPKATLVDDPGGSIARAFGADTSGLVLTFNELGELVYRGGVTASRGHRGPSTAQSTLIQILNGTHTNGVGPVFGCALFEDSCLDSNDCCGSNTQ